MEPHFNLSDQEFELHFANGTLDPTLFSHEAHIRLAWIHVTKYGVDQACENICSQILSFDRTHGDGTKFHYTLTCAAVRAVYHFTQKSNSGDFQNFIAEFPQLKYEFRYLIQTHYRLELITSEEARNSYVEPDLLAFT